jgi:hypothetical protein
MSLKDKAKEYLDPKSKNFMGTGLTLEKMMQVGLAQSIERAFFRQRKEEKKRRLDFIMRLSVELVKIREHTNFATGICEMAIEDVIEGDWKGVEMWAGHFDFAGECKEMQEQYIPIFAAFQQILNEAYTTRPQDPSVQ